MQAAGKSDRASPLGLGRRSLIPNLYDCAIFVLVASAFVLLAHGVQQMGQPLARLDLAPVTLDPDIGRKTSTGGGVGGRD
jgi:hypothetical protein